MWHIAEGSTNQALTGWGPILVAAAGLMTAFVTALTRRDKKQSDLASGTDAKINTALKGLEAVVDRTEKERARWEERATAAEAEAVELRAVNDRLQDEIDELRRRKSPPKKQPTRSRIRRPAE